MKLQYERSITALKARRRRLATMLVSSEDPAGSEQVAELAALQHAIAALEDVKLEIEGEEQRFRPVDESAWRAPEKGT